LVALEVDLEDLDHPQGADDVAVPHVSLDATGWPPGDRVAAG
jgi:hypothetical protein